MKAIFAKIVLLFIIGFIIGCSCRSSKLGEIQSTCNGISEPPIGEGLLKINMFQDTILHMIPIFSADGEVLDTVVYHYDSVTVKKTVRNFIRYFYPEYGLVYFDVDSVDEVYGRYYIGRKKYYVMRNSTTSFFSWSDFLQTVLIEPYNYQELLAEPKHNTRISFCKKRETPVFSCDSVIDDWIHVETDTVCISSQASFFRQGWIQWKIGDSLVVKIYLDC